MNVITDLTAQITLIIVLIILLVPVVIFGLIGHLAEVTYEPLIEAVKSLPENQELKTVNCENCGGPNVDRVTCEWCGQVL